MTSTRTTEIRVDLVAGLVPLLVVAGATWWLFGVAAAYVVQTVGLYGLMAGAIAMLGPGRLGERPGESGEGGEGGEGGEPVGHRGLGPANRVTLARASVVLPVAALAMHPSIYGDAGHWWIIGLSTVALVLDGVDGWMARRTGDTSAFGARFDMELDAFLLIALSVLVWHSGRVGAWVLLIGALRYLFIVAGWLWSALEAELPVSRRRQIICVVQGIALLCCLGPVIPAAAAPPIAATALGSLVYSFGADVGWLIKARARAGSGRQGRER